MSTPPLSAPPPPLESARIIAAARSHFLTHGFRGVTMDDLARELGMSKKTLYTHFPSKTALLEAVIRAKFAGAEAALARISTGQECDFTAVLHDLQAAMRRETEEVQPAFVRDIQREAPELFGSVERFRRDLVQRHFGRILQAGRKAGRIRRDLPVPLMVEILIGVTDAIVNPAKLETLGLSPKTGYSAVITLFLEGALVREQCE
jgi:AcrR family transcriptional regulator